MFLPQSKFTRTFIGQWVYSDYHGTAQVDGRGMMICSTDSVLDVPAWQGL